MGHFVTLTICNQILRGSRIVWLKGFILAFSIVLINIYLAINNLNKRTILTKLHHYHRSHLFTIIDKKEIYFYCFVAQYFHPYFQSPWSEWKVNGILWGSLKTFLILGEMEIALIDVSFRGVFLFESKTFVCPTVVIFPGDSVCSLLDDCVSVLDVFLVRS